MSKTCIDTILKEMVFHSLIVFFTKMMGNTWGEKSNILSYAERADFKK